MNAPSRWGGIRAVAVATPMAAELTILRRALGRHRNKFAAARAQRRIRVSGVASYDGYLRVGSGRMNAPSRWGGIRAAQLVAVATLAHLGEAA